MSITGPVRKVDVKFHSDGRIDISSRVAWVLQMEVGDVIDVVSIGTEHYLYVARRASEISNEMARYHHAVRRRHCNSNTLYCNAVSISKAINSVTGAPESWLFVGTPRSIVIDGHTHMALPLIVGNNQYKKQ